MDPALPAETSASEREVPSRLSTARCGEPCRAIAPQALVPGRSSAQSRPTSAARPARRSAALVGSPRLVGTRRDRRGSTLDVLGSRRPRAAASAASAASIAASSSSGGSSPPSGTTSVFTSATTPSKTSIGIGVAADPLDRVDADLAPVDPHLARPPDLVGDVGRRHRAEEGARGAGLDLEAKHGLAEQLGDLAGLLGGAGLVSCPLRSIFRSSATRPGVATSASRRGSR